MFAKKKRAPMPKGQGAAAAKQMGLFVDFNPEEMAMAMEDNLDDPDLEAELAAITGSTAAAGGRAKPKGRTPLPMEDIARMADECMRDFDDDDEDENLEDDEDLLAELQDVVGDEDAEDAPAVAATPVSSSPSLEMSPTETPTESPAPQQSSSTPGSLQHTLEERIAMYKAAIQSAKASGEASKARRYDRGLKTLETMLTAAKKGRNVNEAEIPPPVATGVPSSASSRPAVPSRPAPPVPTEAMSEPEPPEQQEAPVETETTDDDAPEIVEPDGEEEQSSPASQLPVSSLPSPVEQEEGPTSQSHTSQAEVGEETRAMLLERQREYKMAALSAKKQGEAEKAKLYLRTYKRFDAVIQALEQGQPIDLSGLPPSPALVETQSSASVTEPAATQPVHSPPAATSGPAPPRDILEALEQRKAKYVEASAQAKANGDERKARMHDRIAKQYQSAIRSHKAGKSVNFAELPVPPGFPPIPGQEGAGEVQRFADALEAANQLTSTEATDVGDEDEEEESKPPVPDKPKKPMLSVPPTTSVQKRTPSPSPDRTTSREGLSPTALQQVDFLEGRRKQYMKAALQAKQKNDMDQAKQFLRTAKAFEPMIEAARSGKPVDISKVPSPPGDEDEEFVLVHHSEVQISEKAEAVYIQLAKILKEQHEKCLTISKQFTHLGNIAETTKFEKLAERCKKSLDILRLSQARGLDPPTHHFEERTYNTVRIFPDLSSTEMVVMIVRGMNLPAPSGIQPNDLDAYVKFEFPYPSSEQPQKHKTSVIKNTNSPEYNQSFSLTINRNHRGFRRVVQNKGLKLEVLHKGGFLRSDKPVGTVHVKLDSLETQSEVREIVEVMDGRKATGGRVEVRVRLREPLSGQDLQTVTERWLVLDHSKVLL